MSAQSDLLFSVNRAAGSLEDARGACRAASRGPIPRHHRGLLLAAVRKIQDAEDLLYRAGQDPWEKPAPSPQLSLELAA